MLGSFSIITVYLVEYLFTGSLLFALSLLTTSIIPTLYKNNLYSRKVLMVGMKTMLMRQVVKYSILRIM